MFADKRHVVVGRVGPLSDSGAIFFLPKSAYASQAFDHVEHVGGFVTQIVFGNKDLHGAGKLGVGVVNVGKVGQQHVPDLFGGSYVFKIEADYLKKMSKSIEENRKQCDPMYRLLFDTANVIDVFLGAAIKIVNKKYKAVLLNDLHVQNIFKLMLAHKYDDDDIHIKLVALVFMIVHEPELANAISKMYDQKGGLFEEKGPQMFFKWVQCAKNFVMQLLNHPYNTTNIAESIHNFKKSVDKVYPMGYVLQ